MNTLPTDTASTTLPTLTLGQVREIRENLSHGYLHGLDHGEALIRSSARLCLEPHSKPLTLTLALALALTLPLSSLTLSP
jgi:hypothetical protein